MRATNIGQAIKCYLFITITALLVSACGGGGGGGESAPAPSFSDPIEVRITSASGTKLTSGAGAGGERLFGKQDVSAGATAPLTIVVGNGGMSDIQLNTPSLTGSGAVHFILDASSMSLTLAAQESTSFTIAFDPTNGGVHTATIELQHDASGGAPTPFTFDVAGEGESQGRVLEVLAGGTSGTPVTNGSAASGARDFGVIDPNGGVTAAQQFTLRSIGTEGIMISSAPTLIGSDAADFILDASGVPSQLPAGSSVSFTIAFDPSGTGSKGAILSIGHNAENTSDPFSMEVIGEGDFTGPATMAVEVDNTSIANGDAAGTTFENLHFGVRIPSSGMTTRSFGIENTGPRPITIGSPMLSGSGASAFSIDTSSFDPDLDIGESTSFDVTFTPASRGVFDAELSFTHDALDTTTSPFTVSLSGIGAQGSDAWIWGSNGSDRLGLGFSGDQDTPQQFASLSDVIDVACGDQFTVALRADGTVWTWGEGDRWRLGQGNSNADAALPIQVNLPAPAVNIETGHSVTIVLLADGRMFGWGDAGAGQQVQGSQQSTPRHIHSNVDFLVDIEVTQLGALGLARDGRVWHWGQAQQSGLYNHLGEGTYTSISSIQRVPSLNNIKQIALGGDFQQGGACAAVDDGGRLWMWSTNTQGELADPSTLGNVRSKPATVESLANVAEVDIGTAHVIARLENGDVYCWGRGVEGQIGDGNTNAMNTMPTQVSLGRAAVGVFALDNRSYAVLDDGTVWAWGENSAGQLGDGSSMSRATPVQLNGAPEFTLMRGGPEHTFALQKPAFARPQFEIRSGMSNGPVIPQTSASVGDQYLPLTNVGNNSAESRFFIRNSGGVDITISDMRLAGPDAMDFSLDAGGVVGTNSPSQSADFGVTIAPQSTGEKQAWVEFVHDGTATAWPQSRFYVRAFARNGAPMLRGDLVEINDGQPPSVIATGVDDLQNGINCQYYLDSNGDIYAWGNNQGGYSLGIGSNTTPQSPVKMPVLSNVVKMSIGYLWGSALTAAGDFYVWGFNSWGQFGLGDGNNRSSPTLLPGATNIADFASCDGYLVLLLNDGTLRTCGRNSHGQLGNGNTTSTDTLVTVSGITTATELYAGGSANTVIVKLANGSYMGWGQGDSGQLGVGTAGNHSTPIALPYLMDSQQLLMTDIGCLQLRNDGSLWAWGRNSNGYLGVATSDVAVLTPQRVQLFKEIAWIGASNGRYIARTIEGRAFTWGEQNRLRTTAPALDDELGVDQFEFVAHTGTSRPRYVLR